jgi:hypothetical protein
VDDRALTDCVARLARRDAELAAGIEALRQRDQDVADVRVRAESIDDFFAAYRET